MWLILLAALAAAPAPETPAAVHASALADLLAVPPDRQGNTGYLSLHAYEPGDRDEAFVTLTAALNFVSFRPGLYTPARVGPALVRVDLAALGWDSASRARRIALLKQQGVDTATFKADLWEEFARLDPYWFTDAVGASGRPVRGWLDPAADEALRTLTRHSKAVLRADWLLSKILLDDLDANKGGLYSQALLLPPTEGDLFRAFGVDLKLVDADVLLKSGGAVTTSVVALNNRELQLLPSLYGFDHKYIWRSLDTDKDADGDASVFQAVAGTLKRAGSEHIGVLPNGLGWGYICDADGKQLAVVPDKVAHDKRPNPTRNVRDRRVRGYLSCLDCHGPFSNLYPFDDEVGAVLAKDLPEGRKVNGVVKSKVSQADADARAQDIRDYYFSGLPAKLAAQQSSYAARVKALTGRKPGENSDSICDAAEDYLYDPVTPEAAAREAGLTPEAFGLLCRNSGNPQLVVLSAGRAIRRGAWERAFADLMRADVYTWDQHKP